MLNYGKIIDKSKIELIENGMIANEANSIFCGASDIELKILTDLYSTYAEWSSIYDADELGNLKNYIVPQEVIEFYKLYAPKNGVNLYGDVGLLSLEKMKYENSQMAPGALLIKYGIITFAVTSGGNAVCMDLNMVNSRGPRIIFADHSIFYDKKIKIYKPKREIYELSYKVITDYAPQVAESFYDLLNKIAEKEFDDIEKIV